MILEAPKRRGLSIKSFSKLIAIQNQNTHRLDRLGDEMLCDKFQHYCRNYLHGLFV